MQNKKKLTSQQQVNSGDGFRVHIADWESASGTRTREVFVLHTRISAGSRATAGDGMLREEHEYRSGLG